MLLSDWGYIFYKKYKSIYLYIASYIATHITYGSKGFSVFSVEESNSLRRGLWAVSLCRPFTCTKLLHKTINERQKPTPYQCWCDIIGKCELSVGCLLCLYSNRMNFVLFMSRKTDLDTTMMEKRNKHFM